MPEILWNSHQDRGRAWRVGIHRKPHKYSPTVYASANSMQEDMMLPRQCTIPSAGPIKKLNPTSAQAQETRGKAQPRGRRQAPGASPNNTDTSHPKRRFPRRGSRAAGLRLFPMLGNGGPLAVVRSWGGFYWRPSMLRLWGLGDTPVDLLKDRYADRGRKTD